MLTNNDKNKLLNTKMSYQYLSGFFPSEFYSINNYNPSLTKFNRLQKMDNLNRCLENQYVFSDEINFDLKPILIYCKLTSYRRCFELFKFHLENVMIISDLKMKYKNQKSIVNKVKFLFYDKSITYTVYYYALKMLEILSKYENYYLNEKTASNLYCSNVEIIYTEQKINKMEKAVKDDIILLSENLIELLNSLDSEKYSKVTLNAKEEIKNFYSY